MSDPFRFLIPKGRLFETVRQYLLVSGIRLQAPDRKGYCGTNKDETVEFWIRKPSTIPTLVAKNHERYVIQPVCSDDDEEVLTASRIFHAGLTGEDMILESGWNNVRKVATFNFSSRTFHPTKWVITDLSARAPDFVRRFVQMNSRRENGLIIGCQFLELGKKLLLKNSYGSQFSDCRWYQLDGSEEAAIEDGLCHMVICPVETGESLHENNLNKGFVLMTSHPCIIARESLSVDHEKLLEGLSLILQAADGAGQKVMVTFDLPKARLKELVIPLVGVSPTHSPLVDEAWEAVEVCINRADLMTVLPAIKKAGARAIVVTDIDGFID